MGEFILIVDDDMQKLEEAEKAATAAFPDADVRMLHFLRRRDTRTDAELTWCLYQLCPDILILDNDLASMVSGSMVALRLRLLPGGHLIQIMMYTNQWEKGVCAAVARKPYPDVQYGAANANALQAELRRLKLEKFSGK